MRVDDKNYYVNRQAVVKINVEKCKIWNLLISLN